MINKNPIVFFDFETGSKNADTTQPLELAAVIIDPRKLVVLENTLFHTYIKNLSDEDAVAAKLDPVQKEALDVNGINLNNLKDAPIESIVCKDFVEWTYKVNVKKTKWDSPIAAGFNIRNFDMKIMRRWANLYGYMDKKNDIKYFYPAQTIDLRDITWMLNENNPEIESNSFDAIRSWLDISTEGAHSATVDVLQGAEVLCKCMRLIRYWASKTDFKSRK